MDSQRGTATRPVATIPQGYSAITPWVISDDTRRFLSFIERAFGATTIAIVDSPDGGVGHAEAKIGEAILMAFDAPANAVGRPAFLRLFVEDASKAYANALAAGASAVTEPTLLAFGDRVGRVRDPFGNIWWLQERVEEVDAAELARRWSDPDWMQAMAYVQATLTDALKADA